MTSLLEIRTQKCLQAIAEAEQTQALTADALKNLARWLQEPQYAAYHSGICRLIEEEKFAELDNLFWEVIAFGTGGRRGPMADFGSATINPRTIAESAYGLATYLKNSGQLKSGKAVVACDTRNNSQQFAKLTACVLAATGLTVYYFPHPRSTPELSFAVRYLGCDIGAMISASHNPPADNGFKAYWNTGGQVLPPHDKGIVDCVYDATEIPQVKFEEAVASGSIVLLDTTVDEAYHQAVLNMSLSPLRELNAIYTPLHGVGETACYQILQKAGFSEVKILELQREQNGDFPHVDQHMPNPERFEVFREAIAEAKTTGASLILASDPDADRLGVCVRGAAGEFVHLTGNQIGTLILDYILQQRQAAGTLSPEHFVVETMVTTPLIGDLARSYGVQVVDDLLVGFKYIGETVDKLGPDKFVFGAEESLGFLAGQYARDKDAGIAALYLCEAAAELQKQGKTLLDRLDELSLKFGYYLEGQKSQGCTGSSGKAQINTLMLAFRQTPPEKLAGLPLTRIRDYSNHEIRSLPGNQKISDLPEPSGNLLFLESEPGVTVLRIAVRPSGTEPKIKFYLFLNSQVTDHDLANTKAEAAKIYQAVQQDLVNWIELQLTKS